MSAKCGGLYVTCEFLLKYFFSDNNKYSHPFKSTLFVSPMVIVISIKARSIDKHRSITSRQYSMITASQYNQCNFK